MLVVTLSRATRSYHVLVTGREGPHWRIPANDYTVTVAIYGRPSDPQVGDM